MKLTPLNKGSSNEPVMFKSDTSQYREIPYTDTSIQSKLVLGKAIPSTSILVQNKNNNKYYIKRIINISTQSKSLAQIEKELSIYLQLHHDNILKIISQKYNERELKYELIIPYASQGSLSDIIKRKGCLNEEAACSYFLQLVKVIEYLNIKKKIILKNLNPDIIFIDSNDKVIISDFSNSRKLPKSKTTEKIYDKNEDLFNLGVVLYAMTHGNIKNKYDIDNITDLTLSCQVDMNLVSKECADLIKKLLDINNVIKSVDSNNNEINFKKIYEHAWIKKNSVTTYKEHVLQRYEREKAAYGYGNEQSKDMNEVELSKKQKDFFIPFENENISGDEPSFTSDTKNSNYLLNSKIDDMYDFDKNNHPFDNNNRTDKVSHERLSQFNKKNGFNQSKSKANVISGSNNIIMNKNGNNNQVNRTTNNFYNKNNSIFDSELFDNSSLRVLMEAKKDKSNVPMIKPPDTFRRNENDKRPKLIKPKKSFFDFFKFG